MKKFFIYNLLILSLLTFKVSAIEKVILFGDSLMAGYGLSKEHHLSLVLENNLKQQGFEIEIINGSVSGSTSSGGLNRAEWSLSEPGIDLMILGLGANDMLRGIQPNETKQNLDQIIKIAKDKNIKVILAGMIAPTTHGETYKNNFDLIYPNLAKKYNLPLIPFLLDGIALNPKLNQQDGIHPNKDGVLILSKNIEIKLIDMLK